MKIRLKLMGFPKAKPGDEKTDFERMIIKVRFKTFLGGFFCLRLNMKSRLLTQTLSKKWRFYKTTDK